MVKVAAPSDSDLKVNNGLVKLFADLSADYGWELEITILPDILATCMEMIFLLSTEKEDNEDFVRTEIHKSYFDNGIDISMSTIEKINDIANELGFKWLLSADETVKFLNDIILVLLEFGKQIPTQTNIFIHDHDAITIHLTDINETKSPLLKYQIEYSYYSADSVSKCFIMKIKEKCSCFEIIV